MQDEIHDQEATKPVYCEEQSNGNLFHSDKPESLTYGGASVMEELCIN